jgi:surface antigen
MVKRFTAAAVAATLGFFAVGATPSAARADDPYWQCVTFARMFSGIQIFGDAWTWWTKANGHYAKGSTPQSGAVLVFRPQGAMRLGHVAVVSQVLTDRVIQVTHANWSVIEGSRGKIEKNVTVVDVSPRGDWSEVKVWYDPRRDLGTTSNSTYGFIYQSAQQAGGAAHSAAMTVAHTAAGQVAQALNPTASSPMQSLARATSDSTDRIAALLASVTGGGDDDKTKK